jgi:subtilisin family serine protease
MHIQTLSNQKIELELVPAEVVVEHGRLAVKLAQPEDRAGQIARAAGAFFRLRAEEGLSKEPPLGVFRETATGLLRVVHKQIMLRWAAKAPAKARKQILDDNGLEVVSKNRFVKHQVAVRSRGLKKEGAALVDLANALMGLPEVEFATPDFVSQYVRYGPVAVHPEQWHLKNTAAFAGQKAGEDVGAEGAWGVTQGKRQVVAAVLDDGVDVEHANLKANVHRNPDPSDPRDRVGRDFYIPDDDHPDHFNPRPKLFQFPYDQMTGNDIHGTPCAGVVVAAGKAGGARGIAPKCRVLAVKLFHADNLASDARVADAIRYAAAHADVLSCSWSGGYSPDVELALQDAGAGRQGKGAAVFCAAGNENGRPVRFPASSPHAVAVGASTDQGKLAAYSNVGPELWLVAPSSGGVRGIFTTDVSYPGRGYNIGVAAAGGADGLHTNSFGGTSSATPLAAGVAALVLSVKPALTREQVKGVLRDTADRIGPDHDPVTGHSPKFGYGRVNAREAVLKAKAM